MARKLRSGYTTGACAAAAAKAAVLLAIGAASPKKVEIGFPDKSRHTFAVSNCQRQLDDYREPFFMASVIKDAGDDPDVTNGAEICASIRWVKDGVLKSECVQGPGQGIYLCGGEGIGVVSKPGLAVSPGEPAINPVPREMICQAVREGLAGLTKEVEVTIFIPEGKRLSEKTLNYRLGIIGGLSVLGTTGIVRPVSAEAWTATIEASLSVAQALGVEEVVLSTGRTSEKGVQKMIDLPEEAYVMMGDYLQFSLNAVREAGFKKIHFAGMWAKIMKAAMQIPQTHVRHGALKVEQALQLLESMGVQQKIIDKLQGSNTAREIYVRLREMGEVETIRAVCRKAKDYAATVTGLPVDLYLIGSSGRVEERE